MDKIQAIQNTFNEGLDKDTSFNKYSNTKYFHLENMRVISDNENANGALINYRDVAARVLVTAGFEDNIIGVIPVREFLVIFAVDVHIRTNIYVYREFKNDESTTSISITNTYPLSNIFTNRLSLIYSEYVSGVPSDLILGYTKDHDIIGIGRYETDNLIKVYWCDTNGDKQLRYINIVYNADSNPLNTYNSLNFNIVSDCNYTTPEFNRFVNGNLDSGQVCYSYQLYSRNGTATLFSPSSELIPIFKQESYINGGGFKRDVNTGLGIEIRINGLDTFFNRIRIVAIHYKDLTIQPQIRIIGELEFKTPNLYFVDDGQSLGSISVEEYNLLSNFIPRPKTIETKDNRLFIGNVSLDNFDVEYDARAYRFTNGVYPFTSPTAVLKESDGTQYAILQNGNWNKYSGNTVIASGTNFNLPYKADCINPYNNLATDYSSDPSGITYSKPDDELCMYQSDGSTLGGTGLNVSYKFIVKDNIINRANGSADGYGIFSTITLNANDILAISTNKGFKRDEIYRFGIVFINKEQSHSPVKWIGDIRMPTRAFSPTFYWDAISCVKANNLHVEFTVNNIPPGCSYQIVYVERTDANKTILAQGIMNRLWNNVDENQFQFNNGWTTTWDNIVTPPRVVPDIGIIPGKINVSVRNMSFVSPEDIFNKNLKFNNNDYVELIDYLGLIKYGYNHSPTLQAALTKLEPWLEFNGSSYIYQGLRTVNATRLREVLSSIARVESDFPTIVRKEYPASYIDDERPVEMIGLTNPGDGFYGAVMSHLLLHTLRMNYSPSNPLDTYTGFFDEKYDQTNLSNIKILDYKRALTSQYGGNTYNARTANNYIPCSKLNSGVTTQGDTYIYPVEILWTMKNGSMDGDTDISLVSIMYIPFETTVNSLLRTEECFSRLGNVSKIFLKEKAGTWGNDDSILTQLEPLYQQNATYNRVNNIKKDYPLPFDFINVNKYDTRIYNSEIKYNGEYEDSWLKFKNANRIDVDSYYGSISRLINHNNVLVYFQQKGFGTVSVNQRSVLKDNNTSQLTLGTGGVLDRYDMFSTNYGATQHLHVIRSDSALYFYDELNNKVIRYVGDEEELSVMKGLNSLFATIQPNETDLSRPNISLGYNPKYKEIYITSYRKYDEVSNIPEFTVVFSEYTNNFMTFFTRIPFRYVNNYNFYSYGNYDNNNILYLHDVGEWMPCNIETISCPKENAICIFDNVDLMTEVYNYDVIIDTLPYTLANGLSAWVVPKNIGVRNISGSSKIISNITTFKEVDIPSHKHWWRRVGNTRYNDIIDIPITTGRFRTSHHDTGVINYSWGKNIEKTFRTWRTLVQRAWDYLNNKRTQIRLRDNYLRSLFTFVGGKKIILHDIITYFRSSQL